MFKKLPGDEARNLVSTTPDTAVVFRPAVMNTPAIVTLAIWLYRLVAGLVRLVVRHPLATALPVGLGVIWTLYGWCLSLVTVGSIISAGASWFLLDEPRSCAWSAGGCWPGGGWSPCTGGTGSPSWSSAASGDTSGGATTFPAWCGWSATAGPIASP
jgi:hypothetical protein